MALYKCGGGTMTETQLWSNSAPTSSFGTQTITLNGNISDYKYIKLTYRYTTSDATTIDIYMSTDDYKNKCLYSSTGHIAGRLSPSFVTASKVAYARSSSYVADNQILFGSCVTMNGTTSNNSYCIPTKISGLK